MIEQIKKRRDTPATRDALRQAGTKLFAERGFDGATVEEIAAAAGVNKAMVSYHFGGKQGLFLDILGEAMAWIEQRLRPLRDPEIPADVRLREFVTVWAEAAAQEPSLPPMIVREMISGGRNLDEEFLRRILGVFEIVLAIVTQGTRDGRLRPVDPLLTHLSLMGSLMFFFATAPARERLLAQKRLPVAAPSAEAFVRHMQDLITYGLLAGGEPGAPAPV